MLNNPRTRTRVKWLLAFAPILALGAAWRWTPLGDHLDPQALLSWVGPFRQSSLAPFIAIGAFVVGGFAMVPVTALIVVNALLLGVWKASMVSILGVMLSASLMYATGRRLGRDRVQNLFGDRVAHVAERLNKPGILPIALLRLVPIAPFSIVNFVLGFTRIRFRDYFLGTLAGMGPGIVVLSFFAAQAKSAVQDPGVGTALGAIAALLVLLAGTWWIRRRLAADPAHPDDRASHPNLDGSHA